MKTLKKGLYFIGAIILRFVDKIWNTLDDVYFIVRKSYHFWWNDTSVVFKAWTLIATLECLKLAITAIPASVSHGIVACKAYSKSKANKRATLVGNRIWINPLDWSQSYLAYH